MSTLPACFENIIGLSRTPCECVDDAPVEAGISESGLYLDELPGLNLRVIDATRDCGEGSIWDMMERARANAIEDTKAEIMACIGANTDPARQPGTSQVGVDKKATATGHSLLMAYHGMTLQTAKVKGGSFQVTEIATSFKSDAALPATIELKVYQREAISGDPVATYTLPVINNRTVWTTLPEPLELSMSEFGTDPPRYWFLFTPASGMKAMNDLIKCGCGGTFVPTWNIDNPQYLSRQQKNGMIWADWAMAGGTKGNTLAERDDWSVENMTNGLMLRVKFECDETTSFCSGNPNYATDPIQKVIAHAVRYRAGSNLIASLLSKVEINQYTMTGGKQLKENREEYEKAFNSRIVEYLCPELSNTQNVNRYGDCRKCKDGWGMRRGTLIN